MVFGFIKNLIPGKKEAQEVTDNLPPFSERRSPYADSPQSRFTENPRFDAPTESPPVQSYSYEMEKPKMNLTNETVSAESLKAKIDLLITQMDNLKIGHDILNQRIQNIEKMVKEIYIIAKS
ncbi:MAG: hypothetical protein HYW24_00445 [Candidatus Aenigmarchaeota archaeon]|nr:hypothetical protein [Candidatus Aenigmarchaeota archaeon]